MKTDGRSEDEPKITLRTRFRSRPKLCPKCLGPVKMAHGLSGWLLPEWYRCARCGYQGPVTVEPTDRDPSHA